MESGSGKRDFFLSQKENLIMKFFANLELVLEFSVQEELREKSSTWNIFVRKEEGKGSGIRIILSKKVKGRKGLK